MELTKTNLTKQDGLGIINMNAPANLNAMDLDMTRELVQALLAYDDDPEVKVVVLTHSGKSFCAGGDLAVMRQDLQNGTFNPADYELTRMVSTLALTIKRMKKLVVAAVSGAAAGAGASLAFSCDFIFASENAKFIEAFAAIGFAPDTGGMYLLSRLVGVQRATELCVTCRPLGAQEAKDWGVVYAVCPQEELADKALAFAKKLSKGALLSFENIKKQSFAANFKDYEDYLLHTEQATLTVCGSSADFAEGLAAFAEKRPPQFIGK